MLLTFRGTRMTTSSIKRTCRNFVELFITLLTLAVINSVVVLPTVAAISDAVGQPSRGLDTLAGEVNLVPALHTTPVITEMIEA